MGNVASDQYWGNQIPRLIDYGKQGRLNVRSVKLFTDGKLKFNCPASPVTVLRHHQKAPWGRGVLPS